MLPVGLRETLIIYTWQRSAEYPHWRDVHRRCLHSGWKTIHLILTFWCKKKKRSHLFVIYTVYSRFIFHIGLYIYIYAWKRDRERQREKRGEGASIAGISAWWSKAKKYWNICNFYCWDLIILRFLLLKVLQKKKNFQDHRGGGFTHILHNITAEEERRRSAF